MKKALVFALMVAMVLGLAIPASAATGSPAGTTEDLKPLVVSTTADSYQILSTEEVDQLPEEAQETFAQAKEDLAEAAPEGMAARYFFYLLFTDEEESHTVVFDLDDYTEVVFMQYVDGQWVELEYTINADGTYSVEKVVDGPIAIFVRN